MYDHRLVQKNELVKQMEDQVLKGVDKIEDIKRQFYIGSKTYMKKNFEDIRFYNLAEAQQSEVTTKLFQAFDTLESTDDLKQNITRIVQRRLDDLKKSHLNVNKWELNYNIFENLVDRRAENNRDLYKSFFLKYLSPHMREMVWRGILQDGIVVREYEFNVKKEKAYTVSRDDLFILQSCQSVLRMNFHPMGDESYEQLMVFKSIMIYIQAHIRKTVLPEAYFYIMMPILCVFRNFHTKIREKYLVSFFLTFMENVYNKVVPKIYDRDEREYEKMIRNMSQGIVAITQSIDQEMGKRLKDLLEFEDDDIHTYYMDLMLNVRRGEITHIPNADLTLTKQQVIFGELLRAFVDRVSCGFVTVKTTMVLWDTLLIKQVKDASDILTAFALILLHYKTDVMRCRNVLQLVSMFKEKAPLIHEYDFFVLLFNHYKDKDLGGYFDPPDVGVNRTNFPHIQDVIAGQLKKRLENEDKAMRQRNTSGADIFGQPLPPGTHQGYDDVMRASQYSGGMISNYSGQRPGRMPHMIEDEETIKQLASRLVGKVNLNDVQRDMLRDY